MTLREHAETELKIAGLLDTDSDYNGDIGKSALQIVDLFANQGHSGMSAMITVSVLEKLLRYKPLTDLTDSPDEWYEHKDMSPDGSFWQNKRNGEAFSNDGGKTYYLLSDGSNAKTTVKLYNSVKV